METGRGHGSVEAVVLLRKGLSVAKEGPAGIVTGGLPSYGKDVGRRRTSSGNPVIRLQSSLRWGLNNRVGGLKPSSSGEGP